MDKKNNFQTKEELRRNEHLISESSRNKDGQLIRSVNGKEIIQIEEKTEYDRQLNNAINLWRMRNL